jgi:hypothetical protein
MEERLQPPPDYDFPLEEPSAKELAASLREGNLVLNLKSVPEPVIEIFRDQLMALKDQADPQLICFISRAKKYRYYCIPFSVVAPLLQWVRMSAEKRPRWHLNLIPRLHLLVARNGPRQERISLQKYYNNHSAH